ncbi:MAG: hypothetical protein V2A76_13900 [Planctomycetota bacterium]
MEIVRKNGLLLVAVAAMVLLFTTVTLPALDRDRALAELERRKALELAALQLESRRVQERLRAIEESDPALIERAVRQTFQQGEPIGEGGERR